MDVPEISADLTVERVARGWKVTTSMPIDLEVRVSRVAEAQSAARTEIASMFGIGPAAVGVQITQIVVPEFGDVSPAIHEIVRLRVAAEELEGRASDRIATFAKQMASVDFPMRDIGDLVGISHQRVSQLANAEPTERIDVNTWVERSRWPQNEVLTDAEVATLTGLPVADAVEALAQRYESVSPVPGGRYWPAASVFEFVFSSLPERIAAVPRLFPRVPDPAPAVFEAAVAVSVADVGDFAVHVWRPGDGGPLVAMAYPDRHVQMANSDQVIAAILEQLGPQVSAAAICNGEATSVSRARPGQNPAVERTDDLQPCLMVAERTTEYFPHALGPFGAQNVSRYWWTDLVNLLRVDLPWWPSHLEELGAMLAWRPWSEPQVIIPQGTGVDPRVITGLASIGDSLDVREALEKQAQLCLYRLARSSVSELYGVTPGLVVAAVSAIDPHAAEPQLSVHEKSQILHHRCSQQAAAALFQAVGQWDFLPVLTYGINVDPQEAGPLARQWASRLVDVREDRRDEAGYWRLTGYLGDARAVRWMTDPAAPDSWVIEDADGRLFATVGTRTPNAVGKLAALEIGSDSAFFADSNGTAWPLPDTGFTYYKTGYRGGGPHRLVETIIKLLRDARDDVHEPAGFDSSLRLYELVCTTEAPFEVPEELLLEAAAATLIAT